MEAGWLKQSLREASEAAKQIPEWAREVLDAHEASYGPQASRLRRERAAQTQSQPDENSQPEPSESAQ